MNSLLSLDEQADIRHAMKLTLHRLQAATADCLDSCQCGLCVSRRRTARQLEAMEREECERHTVLVEKIGGGK